MLSAIFSFLGGSAFRMIWGEVSTWLTEKQNHQFEIERMRLQAELEAAQHARQQEAIRLQAELGVKVVQAQAEAAVDAIEAEGWLEAVKSTGRSVGVAWVDAWNAVIRPGGATWAIMMLSANEFGLLSQPLSEGTQAVCFAFLGLFVADRALGKKGK
jgi:hypothetical protein